MATDRPWAGGSVAAMAANTSRGPAAPRDLSRVWLGASMVGLVAGGVLVLGFDQERAAEIVWALTTVVGVVPIARDVIGGLIRRQPGVDLIALIAMVAALALGEYLAGAVIALMLASGQALEAYADRRAHEELSALLARAPRTVSRYEHDELVERPIDEVRQGDRLFVKTGEVVPVDGVLMGDAVLDESALSGESKPVDRPHSDLVRSGAVNAGAGFDLRATASAEESTYAGIVRLVQAAQAEKAPAVRLADRYAAIFIPITLVIAVGAWVASGDPLRFLTVVMVATPCPLILAVPIAIVAGISRSAKRGIIVKGGGALETLARGSVLMFDKTGTLTSGVPTVAEVEAFGDVEPDELLRLAASLDQVSPHVLAAAVVRAAREHDVELEFPDAVTEKHGAGIEGEVGSHRVSLGKASFVSGGLPLPRGARDVRRRSMLDGSSCVFIAVDGEVAGAFLIDDPIRPDTPRVIRSLRRAGIRRVVMVTGDHPDVAESVGAALGVDRILSERAPGEKVEAVEAERAEGGVIIMVGDGLNDAPALAAADVGVAMGARGATASSEAADVVLVVDRLDRLVEAMAIAQALTLDRGAERAARHGARVRLHVPRCIRPLRPRRRGDRAGGHRRRVDPERPARARQREASGEPAPGHRRRRALPRGAPPLRARAAAHPHGGRPSRHDAARRGRGPNSRRSAPSWWNGFPSTRKRRRPRSTRWSPSSWAARTRWPAWRGLTSRSPTSPACTARSSTTCPRPDRATTTSWTCAG